jgi:hypothetical protein
MHKQRMANIFILITFMFIIPSVAENGSITITRLDGQYIDVFDNQFGDAITFFINGGFSTIEFGWSNNENRAVTNALRSLNYSVLNNTTDLGIIKLIEIEYTRRQNELAEIKRKEEQAARDLVNRTHVNTYEWVKG